MSSYFGEFPRSTLPRIAVEHSPPIPQGKNLLSGSRNNLKRTALAKNGILPDKTGVENKHANATTFRKGAKPGPGRPRKPLVDKLIDREIKRFAKQRANTFIEACESLLPLAVDRVGEALKVRGIKHAPIHLRALESLGDRVYGRPAQAITGAGGGPLVVSFQQILGKIPDGKREKI